MALSLSTLVTAFFSLFSTTWTTCFSHPMGFHHLPPAMIHIATSFPDPSGLHWSFSRFSMLHCVSSGSHLPRDPFGNRLAIVFMQVHGLAAHSFFFPQTIVVPGSLVLVRCSQKSNSRQWCTRSSLFALRDCHSSIWKSLTLSLCFWISLAQRCSGMAWQIDALRKNLLSTLYNT